MRFDPGLFGDYASRGVDAVLRLTSKAGDRLRAASDDAIGKMDALQLKKNLIGCMRILGIDPMKRSPAKKTYVQRNGYQTDR